MIDFKQITLKGLTPLPLTLESPQEFGGLILWSVLTLCTKIN